MKRQLLSCLLLIMPLFVIGQTVPKKTNLSVGYWGMYTVHPGAKLGLSIPLKDWKITKDQSRTNNISLFIQPEFGVSTHIDYSTSYLANVNVGTKFQRAGKKFYMGAAIGLAYLAQLDVLSTTVDFQGNIVKQDFGRTDYFFPSINYEVGHELTSVIGWYSKLSFGGKFSLQREAAPILAIEIGLRFSFSTNKNND